MEDGKQLHGGGAIFFLNGDHNMRAMLFAQYHEWQEVASFIATPWLTTEKYVKEDTK